MVYTSRHACFDLFKYLVAEYRGRDRPGVMYHLNFSRWSCAVESGQDIRRNETNLRTQIYRLSSQREFTDICAACRLIGRYL